MECFDVMIVYADKMFLPPPTSLFDMRRQPGSINHSFVRSFFSWGVMSSDVRLTY